MAVDVLEFVLGIIADFVISQTSGIGQLDFSDPANSGLVAVIPF